MKTPSVEVTPDLESGLVIVAEKLEAASTESTSTSTSINTSTRAPFYKRIRCSSILSVLITCVVTAPALFFTFSLCVLFFVGGPAASPGNHGILFIYNPGETTCGGFINATQIVASVSSSIFQGFPGAVADPEQNPICFHKIHISARGRNTSIPIVDYFIEGDEYNIGLSEAAFALYGGGHAGVVTGATWVIV